MHVQKQNRITNNRAGKWEGARVGLESKREGNIERGNAATLSKH